MIKLIVGDCSGDGHNQTKEITIDTNFNKAEINEAFQKGVEIIGEDITNYCDEYEEPYVSKEVVEKLNKFIANDYINELLKEERDEIRIEKDLFVDIYLATVKLGNKNFEYKICEFPEIDIGGYAFFQ